MAGAERPAQETEGEKCKIKLTRPAATECAARRTALVARRIAFVRVFKLTTWKKTSQPKLKLSKASNKRKCRASRAGGSDSEEKTNERKRNQFYENTDQVFVWLHFVRG